MLALTLQVAFLLRDLFPRNSGKGAVSKFSSLHNRLPGSLILSSALYAVVETVDEIQVRTSAYFTRVHHGGGGLWITIL